jgi:hypothetical protein
MPHYMLAKINYSTVSAPLKCSTFKVPKILGTFKSSTHKGMDCVKKFGHFYLMLEPLSQ